MPLRGRPADWATTIAVTIGLFLYALIRQRRA